MEEDLINSITRGKAWFFVGSGLSNSIGYPSWEKLAREAINIAIQDVSKDDLRQAEIFFTQHNYPKVFSCVTQIIGIERLRTKLAQILDKKAPHNTKNIYDIIANWPIPVYLTTNYDDEIQDSLARIEVAYRTYLNSQADFGLITASSEGMIFKIHGDLHTSAGLILTNENYDAIESPAFDYWRTKITSIFDMVPIVILGYSIKDKHIQTILKLTSSSTSIQYPIYWFCPDYLPVEEKKRLLEKYRIRVINYDNTDGNHSCLIQMLEDYDKFIPPRKIKAIKDSLPSAKTTEGTVVTGLYIFNKLLPFSDFDKQRIVILASAIQSVVPLLKGIGEFSIEKALKLAGWPENVTLPAGVETEIASYAQDFGLLKRGNTKYQLSDKAEEMYNSNLLEFKHLQERFVASVQLKIQSNFPNIEKNEAKEIASEIERALVGYFRESGLTFASILFSNQVNSGKTLPPNIINVINSQSHQLTNHFHRQVFCSISLKVFTEASVPEKAYLGRIAQAYFAFHSIGAFGDVAKTRYTEAKNSIWLIDSNVQIFLLALASTLNNSFVQCFSRLKSLGIRMFSTTSLLDETVHHLDFAQRVIDTNGESSPYIYKAARGESPYMKSNEFLEGFIRWQSIGNPRNWGQYMTAIFGKPNPVKNDISNALAEHGIEAIDIEDWPGYTESTEQQIITYTEKIVQKYKDHWVGKRNSNFDQSENNFYDKALPEAEVMAVIINERNGTLNISSELKREKQAWFISATSIINTIEPNTTITWQPASFIKFANTFFPPSENGVYSSTFDTLLLDFIQVGVSFLEPEIIERTFQDIINQSEISFTEQISKYRGTLANKYSEKPQDVIDRIQKIERPIAAIQLLSMISEEKEKQLIYAQNQISDLKQKEKQNREVEKYLNKYLRRKAMIEKNKRKKRGK